MDSHSKDSLSQLNDAINSMNRQTGQNPNENLPEQAERMRKRKKRFILYILPWIVAIVVGALTTFIPIPFYPVLIFLLSTWIYGAWFYALVSFIVKHIRRFFAK